MSNLHQNLHQDIFDRVAKHLLTQNERSIRPIDRICAYRSDAGLKCAIGCLIPDAKYSPDLEGLSAFHTPVLLAIGLPGDDTGDKTIKLLEVLQHLHDYRSVAEWPVHLAAVAARFKLSDAVLFSGVGSK